MINVSERSSRKNQCEKTEVLEKNQCEKIRYSRTGHRWKYGACTLHAG